MKALLISSLLLLVSIQADAKSISIGFSQSDTSESNWRKANTASFKSAAKELGVNLVFLDAGGSTNKQKKQISQLIAKKVNAIILSANQANGWDEILIKAKQAKIPVILSDRTIQLKEENKNKSLYISWIGSDFEYEGKAAASWLAAEVAGNAKIVEISGPPKSSPAILRAKGFRKILKEFPKMKIIDSKTGKWRTERGKVVMSEFLAKHGRNIDVVFAHNDNMAIGAVQAIEDNKKLKLRPGKDIIIIGVDAVKEGFELLVQGKINALVECNPILGNLVLKVVLRVLQGKNVPKKLYSTEKVFNTHNAKKAIKHRKY